MSASDIQTYARALHETLLGIAVSQLRAAAPKLAHINHGADDVQHQIEAALPSNTLPEVRSFLLVLAREGALHSVDDIIQVLESQGGRPVVLRGEVISAVALSDEQQQHIVGELRQRYHSELDLQFSVDETLIGGLIIRVGDQVVDNSLRTRLGMIQRNMLAS